MHHDAIEKTMVGSTLNLLNFSNSLPTTLSDNPVLPSGFCNRLLNDEMEDSEFDQILPARYRAVANMHWTPIRIAKMIASQIDPDSTQRFVDIGSGVGKLCVLLSFLTKLQISGVEQRQRLHEIAEAIVRVNDVKRVQLSNCNMMDIDWENFDIFFLFNPFLEHKLKSDIFIIDKGIEFGECHFLKYVEFVEERIKSLPAGRRLITLEGFGGGIPPSWRLISSEETCDGRLNHWIKKW